jgi:Na+/H+ antiporter NhaD/arsenite permease-like protein
MFTVTISSSLYLYLIYRKDFNKIPELKKLDKINPSKYIQNKKEARLSIIILLIVIVLVLFKDLIYDYTNIKLENGTITLI